MSALYVTYLQNGMLKRAVISKKQYEAYRKDISIKDIQIHGSQNLMEDFYNSTNGISKPIKQILCG